jgi:ABC-type multidrug transport system fused ATPase/permease subunit
MENRNLKSEISNFKLYIRALSYFRESLPRLTFQIFLMGLGVLFGVLGAFPLAILIDGVFGTHRASGGWPYRLFFSLAPASVPGQIITLAAVTLLLRLAQEVLSMVQTLLGIKVGYIGLMKVRCDLFRKLQELQLAYHKSQPQGDAIYRLSYDAYGFQTILNLLVQTMLVSLITLAMMMVIMLGMNWRLTLIALAVIPALLWTSSHYGKIFRAKSLEAKQAESEMTTAIQRSVSSIELVQAFGREADELARFHQTVGQSVKTWLSLHWDEVCYWLLIGTIFGVGGALIFGWGAYMVWRDPNGFTVGELSLFLYYLSQLYGPLNKLSNSGSSLQGGVAGVQRVFEVLDRDVTIADLPGAISLPLRPRMLELDGVGFEYRPGEPVLRDLTVRIEPGQMVAFVGSSGVGKTTLLNLLPRFYDPTTGTLKLDGHDLRAVKLRDLRRHVALVLQENAVLPATVAENIAYGAPGATEAAIAQAAELAGASEFIEALPEKYQTLVGERGSNLSGGQRQRLGIARALLSEAPILVLDEPTSALDPRHEALIVRTLRNLRGKRTVILVSHRLSTVSDCDQIFVMDGGRIVERGTHGEMLALGGLYREMANHQFKLDEEVVAADIKANAHG